MCMLSFNRKIIYSQHEKCKSVSNWLGLAIVSQTIRFINFWCLVRQFFLASAYGSMVAASIAQTRSRNLDDTNKRSAAITLASSRISARFARCGWSLSFVQVVISTNWMWTCSGTTSLSVDFVPKPTLRNIKDHCVSQFPETPSLLRVIKNRFLSCWLKHLLRN